MSRGCVRKKGESSANKNENKQQKQLTLPFPEGKPESERRAKNTKKIKLGK